MSNRYDHALGRLDALFEEAKRIRDEVESMKAAEQARVRTIEPSKPAPVVERFVMWDYFEYDSITLEDGGHFHSRRKRGGVVADFHETYWRVTLSSGESVCLYGPIYKILKNFGCFGDQV